MSKFPNFPRQVKRALPLDFTLERDPKNIFYYQRDVDNYTDQVLNFFYSIDVNIHTRNFPVCNSGQHTYVTGLFNFFFVLSDLIDRIDFFFREYSFRGTCFLLASNTHVTSFFQCK